MAGVVTIYDEGVEWVFSTNAPARVQSGPGGAHTGVNSIGGTNDNAGDTAVLTAPAPVTLSAFSFLSFWLTPIGANWTNALSDFTVFWLNAGGTQIGNTISVKTAAYGFNAGSAVYQNVIVPVSDFGVAAPVSGLQFTALPKTTYSFLLDTVTLNPMALQCDGSSLANAASCFSCLEPMGLQLPLQTYLLAQMAFNAGAIASADPAVLARDPNVAKFMQTIPIGMQMAVQNFLLCQLVNK